MYKVIFRFIGVVLVAGNLAVMNAPSYAAGSAMLELLKILKDKGSISQQEYDLLKKTAAQKPAEVSSKAKPPPKITMKGKLEFKTDEHKFRIGGRAMHDITLVGNDDSGSIGSSEQQFRRARIYLSGTAWKYWDWKFQFDLEDADDTGMAIEDAYIKYKGLGSGNLTIGQRKAPFSLSALTSSKYITFIERSVPTDLFTSESIGIGNRAPGITLDNIGKNHSVAGGFYMMRQRSGSSGAISERKIDDGWGVTGRATFLPVNRSKKNLVHVGAAFGYKHYPSKTVNRFRVRPAVSEGDRIVDSDGNINADNFWGVGLEAASIWGPFSASGEYYYGDFDGAESNQGMDLEGFYVQGSYFLTGENRRYNKGAFSSVKVKNPVGGGGWGAWEVGLRYSSAELGGSIGADSGDVLTAALNWYVNNNMMFKLNYVKTFCAGSGNDICDWGIGDGDPEYLSFRTQVFF